MVTCGPATNTGLSTETHKIKKDKFLSLLETLKELFLDKDIRWHFILVLVATPVWFYTLIIRFHWWDIILQPLAIMLGVRVAQYGLLGLVPGGGWLHKKHFHTIHFWPELKTWRQRLMFLCENNFTVAHFYISKEMHKGDPTSVREVTGPVCVTIGLGFNKYIFDIDLDTYAPDNHIIRRSLCS